MPQADFEAPRVAAVEASGALTFARLKVKIGDLTSETRHGLSPLKRKVLRYMEDHDDEVFAYRDLQLARELELKPSAQGFTLWALHRDGFIDKEEVDGKVYFGSRRAIGELRRRLGLEKRDPFERAKTNAERIRQRTGNFSVAELLRAVRDE